MNIKLAVFNFKNELTIDQLDESNILQKHLNVFESMSEKEIVNSLNESLNSFNYQPNVKMFLESVKEEIVSKPIVYDLKDLYKKVERANLGVLYRPALNTILQIINRDNDDFIMEGILNELSIFDWIPEVKSFLISLNKNPYEIQNMEGNGKAYSVFTIVEKIEEGSLAYVGNSWFLINEEKIEKVTIDEYIENQEKIRQIRILEQVMAMGTFNKDVISLYIDEGFSVGISTKDSTLYLNDEKADKETTLESLFNSPLVPYLKKDYYLLIEAVKNNVEKFMDLDIALRVNNPIKPYLENFCFNYKNNMYLYTKDNRIGNSFFKYENATDLIVDVRKELDYDVSKFFENKLSKEAKELRQLEDKEKTIDLKIKDVNESIEMLTEQKDILEESEDLRTTLNQLISFKKKLSNESNSIKKQKTTARKFI